ncbi:MAG TPA: methane monooxygenase/ammonia monooxygenase subunit C, partial [Porticoccaceae bacterium]|nr:methane monooxygenase/ammonia monooxygenase subunit C [Porticoccaceae bacterium]
SVIAEDFQDVSESEAGPGIGFYLRDWPWLALGMVFLAVLYGFAIWFQQSFGHAYGMDAHAPEFDTYFMTFLYTELTLEPLVAIALWGYLWFSREESLEGMSAQEEVRRYFSYVMWLIVYTFAVYWAASYFAEQDASWHQVVTRDTSFTPSHIVLFYLSFPVYIILGVGSLLYGYTRLPIMQREGVSVPHVLAVVGPFMILPNVGLNEWGHAFWFMEEIFTAPLHWGFVVLGWAGLALGGVLVQIVQRVNELLPELKNG